MPRIHYVHHTYKYGIEILWKFSCWNCEFLNLFLRFSNTCNKGNSTLPIEGGFASHYHNTIALWHELTDLMMTSMVCQGVFCSRNCQIQKGFQNLYFQEYEPQITQQVLVPCPQCTARTVQVKINNNNNNNNKTQQ